MKKNKPKKFIPYLYVRLDEKEKERVKKRAEKDGSNMTIWVRQLIFNELDKPTKGVK